MIVRILTARVSSRNAPAFEDLMRRQLPRMRQFEGLLYVKLARQITEEGESILLFEEWRDRTSLYNWAGAELSKPRLLPGAEALTDDLSVTHYEALDVDPDSLLATEEGLERRTTAS
jgi:heme-degrading monooxygenase HmoA